MERQHGVKHLNSDPDFIPRNPKIVVSVFELPESGVGVEWDVRACESLIPEPGRWQRLRPGEVVPR